MMALCHEWNLATAFMMQREKKRAALPIVASWSSNFSFFPTGWTSTATFWNIGIRRIDVNFPGKVKLFPIGMYTNFGDWGYDELTSPEKGFFRHEVLFSSGATITVEFGDISVDRKRAK
jgi:hypothetical protein